MIQASSNKAKYSLSFNLNILSMSCSQLNLWKIWRVFNPDFQSQIFGMLEQ